MKAVQEEISYVFNFKLNIQGSIKCRNEGLELESGGSGTIAELSQRKGNWPWAVTISILFLKLPIPITY